MFKLKKEFETLRIKAIQGKATPDEYNRLGSKYHHGEGVAKDEVEAVKWFRKAAEKGYASAQYTLGEMYANGRGVAKDEVEAGKWYRKAAEQGDKDAQLNLGFMYEEGRGVAKDEVEAFKWLRKAAEQGFARAQLNLGFMYELGRGVAKDEVESFKWYRKAAEQGCELAQYSLGQIYELGRGVTEDGVEAFKWYRKAAEQGCELAQNKMKLLTTQGVSLPQKVSLVPHGVVTPFIPQKRPTSQSFSLLSSHRPHAPSLFQPSSPLSLNDAWKIKHSDITLGKQLGSGGCGAVYKATWRGTKVAIKELHAGMNSATLAEFQREAQLAAALRHLHVVQLYGATQTSPYYMVMEYMKKGALYDVLRKETLTWEVRTQFAIKVALGLSFLHEENIIHRDIKSLNVLISDSNEVKLADFGLATVKQSTRSVSKQSGGDGRVGTLHWKAPELFKMGSKHTRESDVYSLGIVFWEIVTGRLPYEQAEDEYQISVYVREGQREEIPLNVPLFLRNLIMTLSRNTC